MPKVLTEEQVTGYQKNGFVSPVPVFNAAEIAACRTDVEQTETTMGEFFRGIGQTKFYLRFPWAFKMATHPKLLDAVEDLIGPDIMIYHNTAWIKEPSDNAYVSWHQDNTYFGHDPCEVLTAWIALSPATEQSGCMQFLPGSHKGKVKKHKDTFDKNNLLTRGQTIENVPKKETVPIILKPGQLSLHHPLTVHASGLNKSKSKRIGFAIQSYIGSNVNQIIGKTFVQQARGEDLFMYHKHTTRPSELMNEKDLELRNKSNEELQKILYKDAKKIGEY